MIPLLNFILKAIAWLIHIYILVLLTLISIILWDKKFMEYAEEIEEDIKYNK